MSDDRRTPAGRWKDNPYAADLGDMDPMRALADTPERLRSLAERMTQDQFARSYAPGKWTAAQLFVHLAEVELAFSLRVRMAVTTDDYVVQPFDQDAWLAREPDIPGLDALRAYYAMRQFNLPLYRSLTPAERRRRLTHPERGAMLVEWVLEHLAGHERHHLPHFEAIVRS
jgi:uncharacterized damage-inducible protein DinB